MTSRDSAKAIPTTDDIVRLCGTMPDWKIAKIIACKPTYAELEIALAWSQGESDVMGEERLPLAGRAAEVFDILTADEDMWEDERR